MLIGPMILDRPLISPVGRVDEPSDVFKRTHAPLQTLEGAVPAVSQPSVTRCEETRYKQMFFLLVTKYPLHTSALDIGGSPPGRAATDQLQRLWRESTTTQVDRPAPRWQQKRAWPKIDGMVGARHDRRSSSRAGKIDDGLD